MSIDEYDFPLRTNYELTRILTAYNGSNEVEIIKENLDELVNKSWIENKKTNSLEPGTQIKSAVPHNFTLAIGYPLNVLSREFCQYATSNKKVNDLLKWLEDTSTPHKMYFCSFFSFIFINFIKINFIFQ